MARPNPRWLARGPWGAIKRIPSRSMATHSNTLVKTASEVVLRHEQQLQASLHKTITVIVNDQPVRVALDVVPDEDEPHALLSAHDPDGAQLAQVRVRADFKLNAVSAEAWIAGGYGKPK